MILPENDPKVSIITTIYKHRNKLSLAIESMLSQKYKNIEIILVNNNAIPETLAVANEYQTRYPEIIRIVFEPTQGIASARNRGIIEAKGEFVSFCDEDDIWVPDKIKKQLQIQQDHPEFSIITNLVNFISYDDGQIVELNQNFSPQFWAIELFGNTEKFKKHPIYNPHPSTMFFRRSLAIDVGLFDEKFNPYWTEDTEFSLRMYEKGPIYLIPETLTHIRLSSKNYLKDRQGDFDWVAIKNLNYFFSILYKKYGTQKDKRNALIKIRAQWMRELSIRFLIYREGKSYCRQLLIRSLKDQPINPKTWKTYIRTFAPENYLPRIFHFEHVKNEKLPTEINEDFFKNLFSMAD